ncbi:MAG: DNA-deoxyinosine glycosylase [Clostridia bacterium]|nr:DNA-deoxyinosine glycosylase [Clostridia bacterium]MBR3553188.1 DNA-deoxyinosine glycosylase [Clostridia bacterium]
MLTHPIPPVFDEHSRVLILGSFPSVKSRAAQFFYGHPQNRFWPLMAALFGEPAGETPKEKTAFLLRHHIALWDVIAACEITGSADSTIKNVTPNDLSPIFGTANLRAVLTNGKTADTLYRRYLEPQTHRSAVCLPSTSPANARWTMAKLTEAWGEEFHKNGLDILLKV